MSPFAPSVLAAAGFLLALSSAPSLAAESPAALTTAEVLEQAPPGDWRNPDPAHTLYLELPAGRVVIELASRFAPAHAVNIAALAHEHYWDGLAILRSQDNYVVQWGDPNAGSDEAHSLGAAKTKLRAEFDRGAEGLPFTVLSDGDVYAPQVGWSEGFPAARDPASGRAWLTHCYGMVGAGRDAAADSSNGAELYVVIGHAPRHLDRNITVVGRVLSGMQWLSTLPRGTGPLGFYEQPEQRLTIPHLRLAADVPDAERSNLQVLRTDSASFAKLIEARRNRREDWFIDPVGHVELCNVPIPVREQP